MLLQLVPGCYNILGVGDRHVHHAKLELNTFFSAGMEIDHRWSPPPPAPQLWLYLLRAMGLRCTNTDLNGIASQK